LIAIVGIKDIVRKGVKPVLEKCKSLGINLRMMSNEGRYTAIGTAREAGILSADWVEKQFDYTLIEGCDFRDLVGGIVNESGEARNTALNNFKVIKDSLKIIFRASEQDKYILAEALKVCGHVVAVAGSGTNDSEAMRRADISLTMAGTANHVAKEAADIIFFDDNFGSILKTIKWGRHVFINVKKFLVLQLTINLVAAIVTLFGAVFHGEGPLHPMQMLWTNLTI
jgi:P-type Ca2+ transporter type 2C